MDIEVVTEVTGELHDAVQRLIPLLGFHKSKPSRDDLAALVGSDSSSLLVARFPNENSQIVGILTISIYRVPTGIRSIVEDVVVDKGYRGKGIAKALLQHAIEIARKAGANGVALTSNPKRVEANQLYLALGFEKRETNSYFFKTK
jgi:GNAT superfamily N-acetyltransferase